MFDAPCHPLSNAWRAGCSGSGELHSQLAENRELLAERGQKLERLQDRTAMMESDAQVTEP